MAAASTTGGAGATAYADAVAVYLAFGVDRRVPDISTALCSVGQTDHEV